jgi:aspartyl-tRNA(Asn)/glutamyl-tRNA(Gln) amidotransferase subunit A
MPAPAPSLDTLAADLAAGRTTSRALVEACLKRIADPAGEGAKTFIAVDAARARRAAEAMDALRAAGAAPSRFAGIPISVKDLFDVAGEVTAAGSKVLADAAPATADAPVMARLRAAGFVLIGRTNMTEFAYSGIGINPHHGTPAAPWQRGSTPRVPGGSSSGAAVSVADGMAHGAIGTDTGGSCRIPAAFCGITGYKPTARLIPQQGIVPLAPSLDAAGPLARTVRCCASLHALLAGAGDDAVDELPLAGLRLGVPQTVALDDLDAEVATTFKATLDRLSAAGARIVDVPFTAFGRVGPMNAKGGFPAMESHAWHAPWIASRKALYDPRVVVRILRGADASAADYLALLAARRDLIAEAEAQLAPLDALVLPTVATVPPTIASLATDDDAFARANILALRNCTLINVIDGCAISLPVQQPGEAPVGLMLAAAGGQDRRLFALAAAVERVAVQA